MKKIGFLILAALLVSAVGTPAFAGYWQQEWTQSSSELYGGSPVGQFDGLGVVWVSGATFTDAALSGFNNGGVPDTDWNITNFSNKFAYAQSSALKDDADFFINFEEAFGTTGSTFYFGLSKGNSQDIGNFLQGQSYSYNGASWTSNGEITGDTLMDQLKAVAPGALPPGSVTPEPISSTLFLLGVGTLGLGVLRRKRSKK